MRGRDKRNKERRWKGVADGVFKPCWGHGRCDTICQDDNASVLANRVFIKLSAAKLFIGLFYIRFTY